MLRIAITGPESSGKTTLARALSKVLSAVYIPEFARQYLQEKGLKYDQQDLDEIAKGQLNLILSSQNSINKRQKSGDEIENLCNSLYDLNSLPIFFETKFSNLLKLEFTIWSCDGAQTTVIYFILQNQIKG